MKIDLSNEELFYENEINFDKNLNFVFGKNGTGKSTLTKLLKEYGEQDYDVRVFQGFENMVGENNRLNAVILGEENNEIAQEIEIKKEDIKKKKEEIDKINLEIKEPKDNSENLWKKFEKIKKNINQKNSQTQDFYTDSAAKIKKMTDPQISKTTYNKNDFISEKKNAKLLGEADIKSLKKLIKTEVKMAQEIEFPSINLQNELEKINSILGKKVEEKVKIKRLENNEEKRNFAKKGFHLHEAGEICSFCGNIIKQEEYEELKRYFLADDIEKFQKEIEIFKDNYKKKIESIENIKFDKNNFYPNNIERLTQIIEEYEVIKEGIIKILKNFLENLEKKDIFKESEKIFIDNIFLNFNKISEEYDDLVKNNNSSNLSEEKEKAKTDLRYHFIKLALDEFNEKTKLYELNVLKEKESEYKTEIENKEKEIIKLNNEINNLNLEINKLEAQTKNEKKLVENINKKIRHYTSFELVHKEDTEGEGFYSVKCLRTNEDRDITQISTGEKNIIALLYFIEKLNEINEVRAGNKLIIFDDPMNSNDDTMQYLIIEELQKLMRELLKNNKDDKFILMTHNVHFYINIKYDFDKDDDYKKKRNFIRLVSDTKKTKINYIKNKDDDFETSYESLWHEINILFRLSSCNPVMLLNPMRRIVETYTKFNGLKQRNFLSKVEGANKFFNVNSHGIDDLEADLNGKSKENIIEIFKECFEKNNSIEHFKIFWKEENIE
ncbi:MAG: AAA family ATPase [Fusobacterium periodonticum]|jgi:cation transport ATPase|nr:AAA family ATPase [Fusobacterium periodonticum]